MSNDRSLVRAVSALFMGVVFLQAQPPVGSLESQKAFERVNNALAHLARAPGNSSNLNEAAAALAAYTALPVQDVGQALGGALGLSQIRQAAMYYSSLPSDVQKSGNEAAIEGYKWIAEMLAESRNTLKILGVKVLDLAGGSADVVQGGLDAADGYVDGNKTKVEQGLLDAASALVPGTTPIAMLKALAEGALRESFHQQGLTNEQIDERINSIELPAFDAGLNTFSGDWLSAPGQPQTISGVVISAIKLAINNVTGGGLAGADAVNQFLASQQGQEILQSAVDAAKAGVNSSTVGGLAGADATGQVVGANPTSATAASGAGGVATTATSPGQQGATDGARDSSQPPYSSTTSPRPTVQPPDGGTTPLLVTAQPPDGSTTTTPGGAQATASNGWCNGDLCQAWHDGGERGAFGDPAYTDTAASAAAAAARQQFYNQNPQLVRFQSTAAYMSPATEVDAAVQQGSLIALTSAFTNGSDSASSMTSSSVIGTGQPASGNPQSELGNNSPTLSTEQTPNQPISTDSSAQGVVFQSKYHSFDGGHTWLQNAGTPFEGIGPGPSNTIVNGAYHSFDGGQTWLLNAGTPFDSQDSSSLTSPTATQQSGQGTDQAQQPTTSATTPVSGDQPIPPDTGQILGGGTFFPARPGSGQTWPIPPQAPSVDPIQGSWVITGNSGGCDPVEGMSGIGYGFGIARQGANTFSSSGGIITKTGSGTYVSRSGGGSNPDIQSWQNVYHVSGSTLQVSETIQYIAQIFGIVGGSVVSVGTQSRVCTEQVTARKTSSTPTTAASKNTTKTSGSTKPSSTAQTSQSATTNQQPLNQQSGSQQPARKALGSPSPSTVGATTPSTMPAPTRTVDAVRSGANPIIKSDLENLSHEIERINLKVRDSLQRFQSAVASGVPVATPSSSRDARFPGQDQPPGNRSGAQQFARPSTTVPASPMSLRPQSLASRSPLIPITTGGTQPIPAAETKPGGILLIAPQHYKTDSSVDGKVDKMIAAGDEDKAKPPKK